MQKIIDRSFFIIKPEAFAERKKIISIINGNPDLSVTRTKTIRLSEADIDTIYLDDIGTPLLKAIKMHLSGKTVLAGIAEGPDAVNRLRNVCGDKADPKLCGKKTIRRIFGLPDPIMYCGQKFFLNAIHSAIKSEAEISLDWFYNQK